MVAFGDSGIWWIPRENLCIILWVSFPSWSLTTVAATLRGCPGLQPPYWGPALNSLQMGVAFRRNLASVVNPASSVTNHRLFFILCWCWTCDACHSACSATTHRNKCGSCCFPHKIEAFTCALRSLSSYEKRRIQFPLPRGSILSSVFPKYWRSRQHFFVGFKECKIDWALSGRRNAYYRRVSLLSFLTLQSKEVINSHIVDIRWVSNVSP